MRGLVNGLQNRLHPFESGTDLIGKHDYSSIFLHGDMLFFIFPRNAIPLRTRHDSPKHQSHILTTPTR